MSTTANYVKEINIPQNYSEYYEELSKQVYKEFETAAVSYTHLTLPTNREV